MGTNKHQPKAAKNDSEWLANICKFLSETDHLTELEAREILQAEGVDPNKVLENGLAFIESLRRQATYRTLAEAREKQKHVLEALSNVPQPSGTLAEIKAQIRAKWEVWTTHGATKVAFAFRNLDQMTEDDLRSLLSDIERVERLQKPGEK